MSALILMAVLSAEPQTCFWPVDGSPGWKQVSLPREAEALAAPDGVDQFRSDETVEVVDDHPQVFLAGSQHFGGKTAFELTPGNGACRLEVQFKAALRGAKVDVSAWGSNGSMALKREERVAGSSLSASWGDVGVRAISVQVHDHMRDEPVVASWRTSCQLPANRLPVGDAFRLGRSLYYYQPSGARVALCQRPGAVMRVKGNNLPGQTLPASTAMNRG